MRSTGRFGPCSGALLGYDHGGVASREELPLAQVSAPEAGSGAELSRRHERVRNEQNWSNSGVPLSVGVQSSAPLVIGRFSTVAAARMRATVKL